MALINLPPPASENSFMPIIKYNAKAGRFSRVDRQDGSNNEVDITNSFSAVFDFEFVEVGYINFSSSAPDYIMVPYGQNPPTPPSSAFKQGFRILIKLSAGCGGDVREFSSNARNTVMGINELHDAYLEGVKQNPGMLPVVVVSQYVAVTAGTPPNKTTNYQPQFAIQRWVPRPKDLVLSPRGISNPAAIHAQPSTTIAQAPAPGNTRVGAPISGGPAQQAAYAAPPPPVQQPVMAEEDFG